MTYEEFITKHNLQLELIWKGFEVRPPVTKDAKPWPCFKWQYNVYKQLQWGRSEVQGDYATSIGHGKWYGLLAAKSRNRGGIAYNPKVGLHFKLHSSGCYPLVRSGEDTPYGDNPELPKRPYFEFEDPDCRFRGPRYFVNRPTFPDILNSLRSDVGCAYPTFEEFAYSLGYDQDSRSAEKIYWACCELERKLRGVLGREGIIELLEEVEGL